MTAALVLPRITERKSRSWLHAARLGIALPALSFVLIIAWQHIDRKYSP